MDTNRTVWIILSVNHNKELKFKPDDYDRGKGGRRKPDLAFIILSSLLSR
jgi:hypothetical protein